MFAMPEKMFSGVQVWEGAGGDETTPITKEGDITMQYLVSASDFCVLRRGHYGIPSN